MLLEMLCKLLLYIQILVKLLIAFFEKINFESDFVKWLRSYLVNSSQKVNFNNCFSNIFLVLVHLGPILFNLFFNDKIN